MRALQAIVADSRPTAREDPARRLPAMRALQEHWRGPRVGSVRPWHKGCSLRASIVLVCTTECHGFGSCYLYFFILFLPKLSASDGDAVMLPVQNQRAKFDAARSSTDRSRRGVPCDRSRRPSIDQTDLSETALSRVPVGGERLLQGGEGVRVVYDHAQLAVVVERGRREVLRSDEATFPIGDDRLGVDV